MPRPRYAQGEKTARERLDAAFWACLREQPFEKVTVADLVKRAGVNRNTFYYHFEDLNDLACTVVKETAVEPEFIRMILGRVLRGAGSEVLAQVPDMDTRVDHMCLLASKHSTPELQEMLRNAIEGAWCEALGINPDTLDLEGRLAMEFALGGFMGVIAYRADSGNEYDLCEVFDCGLSIDGMRLLRHIPEIRDKLPLV